MIDEIAIALDAFHKAKSLALADKAESIRQKSPFSSRINEYIRSGKELDLYLNMGHREFFISRPALIFDIAPFFSAPGKENNLDRMLSGKPPYDAQTGSVIDLHHIGQQYEAPFAELPHIVHDAAGINSMLHPSRRPSWRQDPKLVSEHNKEVAQYWTIRGELFRIFLQILYESRQTR